jgi:hypothetical protein
MSQIEKDTQNLLNRFYKTREELFFIINDLFDKDLIKYVLYSLVDLRFQLEEVTGNINFSELDEFQDKDLK